MNESPFYNNNTNPNAGGGVNAPDARTGLGIGSLGGDPNSRLGQPYQGMGDALSSPKGPYDVVDEEELEVSKKKKNKDKDKFKLDIEDKLSLSLQVQPTDSLAHKGTDTSYFGGLGNSIASVIASGENISGNLVAEQCLKQYIKEALIVELGISGNVNASGKWAKNTGGKSGKHYHIDSTTLGSMGGVHTGAYINSKGYKQSHNATTDGAEAVYDSDLDKEAYDDDEKLVNLSTYQILDRTSSKEFYDEENVNKHKRRRFD